MINSSQRLKRIELKLTFIYCETYRHLNDQQPVLYLGLGPNYQTKLDALQ